MTDHHTRAYPAPTRTHFLEELSLEVERTEAALTEAIRRLAAIDALHERMMDKVERDAPQPDQRALQLGRLTAQRDRMVNEINFPALYSAHEEAILRHERVFEAIMIGNRFSLESVIRINLRRMLFGKTECHHLAPQDRDALKALARAIRDYLWVFPSDATDARIRESWHRLERVS